MAKDKPQELFRTVVDILFVKASDISQNCVIECGKMVTTHYLLSSINNIHQHSKVVYLLKNVYGKIEKIE